MQARMRWVRRFRVGCWVMLIGGLLVVDASPAATNYVASWGSHTPPYDSWATAATNIQAAVDAAVDGNVVLLAWQTYYPTATITVTNAITVRGDGNATLYGPGWGSGVRGFELAHAGAVLENLSLSSFDARPGDGGAVLITAPATLRNVGIYDCTGNRGGLIAVTAGGAGSTLVECDLSGGQADAEGGGLYVEGDLLVDRCAIRSCYSQVTGGGIYDAGGLRIRGSTVFSCYSNGGGPGPGGGGIYLSDSGVVENCTIVNCNAWNQSGGGLYCSPGGQVINTVFESNAAASDPDANDPLTGTNFVNCCSASVLTGTGNLIASPGLVDPATGNDLSLGAGSPCIDAGTNRSWMAGAQDLNGTPRIVNGTVDIGAYETTVQCGFSADVREGIAPLPVVFTAEVYTAGATLTAYRWDFDNDGSWDLEGAGLDVVTNVYGVGLHSVRLAIDTTGGSATRTEADFIRAGAGDIYVSSTGGHVSPYATWADAATNLAAALEAGAGDSVVHVANGAYTNAWTVTVSRGIRVVSENGTGAAALDGRGLYRVIILDHPDAVLEGFTVRNGRCEDYQGGGGLLIQSGGTVRSCVVSECESPYSGGGGISIWTTGTVDTCTVVSNTAKRGGGIYTEGGGTLLDSTVSGNIATNEHGGGLYIKNGTVVSNCTVEGNRAYYGGGVYSSYNEGRIVACRVRDNHADEGGGGVYVASGERIEDTEISGNTARLNGGVRAYGTTVVRCRITGNHAEYSGGGIGDSGNSSVTNCLIAANTAGDSVGGVGVGWGSVFEHCTIVGNAVGARAGGVALYSQGTLVNCLVADNQAPLYPNHDLSLAPPYGFSYSRSEPLPPGDGNIDDAPRFVDPATEDYRIRWLSACRDAGTNLAWAASGTDLGGTPRLLGASPDMGCYEFSGAPIGVTFAAAPPLWDRAPMSVAFTSEVYNAEPTNLTYRWDFDHDGFVDLSGVGLAAVTHVYAVPGVYSVSLTIETGAGESDREVAADLVTVIAPTATVHYVSPAGTHQSPYTSWANAATTIQAAVDVAAPGDTVMLDDGTFVITNTVSVTEGILLTSSNGRDHTAIDGADLHRCLYVDHPHAVVQGIELVRGQAESGGGIWARNGAMVSDCRIALCTATAVSRPAGGGFLLENAVLQDSLVISNEARYGGGGYLAGADALVSNCVFEANTSVVIAAGAYLLDDAMLVDSEVRGNHSGLHVGGVQVDGSGTVLRCIIESNRTQNIAGGVDLSNGGRVLDSVIRDNVAINGNCGGVSLSEGGRVRNSLIVGNRCYGAGGGISVSSSAEAVVESCTVYGNTAGDGGYGEGGGIYTYDGGAIRGTILFGNTADAGNDFSGNIAPLDHCAVSPDPGGTLNVTNDPTFVDAPGGDFTLATNSPCINAGLNQAWMTGAVDLAGQPRIQYAVPDIGAFESSVERYGVDFSANPVDGLTPLEVTFTALLAGEVPDAAWFEWDFDDDSTPEQSGYGLVVVSNTYASAGIYDVSVTVSNSAGEVTGASKPGLVTVDWAPLQAGFTAAPTEGLLPLEVVFSATVTNYDPAVLHFAWDFDEDGTVDASGVGLEVVTNLYTVKDRYGVSLTVSNAPAPVTTVTRPNFIRAAPPPATLHVSPAGSATPPYADWASAAHTIEDAMAAAVRWDVILVTNGVYTPAGTLVNTNELILRGVAGAAATILDGGGTHRVVEMAGLDGVLDGFTLRNGDAAFGDGGGILLEGGGTVTGCVIEACEAVAGGGAAAIGGGLIVDCTVVSNRSTGTVIPKFGGGIYLEGGGEIRNSLVADNTATLAGGVFLEGGGTIESCTVAGNTSGGVYCNFGGTLRNTILYHNPGTLDLSVNGGWDEATALCCSNYLSPGGTTGDPRFLDPDAGDYRLSPISSCIDLGSHRGWMTGATDLAGNPRILGGAVDIGCYEFDPVPLSGDFDAVPTAGLAPLEVVFTAAVGGSNQTGLVYTWDFDGDGTGDLSGPGRVTVSNLYLTPGLYTPVLRIDNTGGESVTVTKRDHVQAAPPVLYVSRNGDHLYPYSDWTAAATSLTTALDASLDGSRIVVSNGTYDLERTLRVDRGVVVESRSGAASTILRGNYTFRCVELADDAAVLDGFTLIQGNAPGGNDRDGGGILFSANALARNCEIYACQAINGAGVAFSGGGILEHSSVHHCQSWNGGGMVFYGTGVARSCMISSNTAAYSAPNGRGGGAYFRSGGTLENCVLDGNHAWEQGGGVYSSGGGTVQNCTLVGNQSDHEAGGIYSWSGTPLEVRNSVVRGNTGLTGDDYYDPFQEIAFDHCCLGQNPGTNAVSCFTNAPGFVTMSTGPYRTASGSPCIDTGTAPGAPALDIDGLPRPVDGNDNGTVLGDVGASEYVPDTIDTDGDGIPDMEEVFIHGSSPIASDSDGDGQTDLQEWIAGTNLGDGTDAWGMETPVDTSGPTGPVIAWDTLPGRLYRVWRSADLVTWNMVYEVPGDGAPKSFTNDVADSEAFLSLDVRLAP